MSTSDGKIAAILSYITPLGLIIAIIMNSNNKSSLASYHIRNAIGLVLAWIVIIGLDNIFLPYYIVRMLNIAVFVLGIIGFIGAIQGEEKEIPIVGKLFQDWFRSI